MPEHEIRLDPEYELPEVLNVLHLDEKTALKLSTEVRHPEPGKSKRVLRVASVERVPCQYFYVDLEPDPARAAELKERERLCELLRAAKAKAMQENDYTATARLRDVLDAIDAPLETVSEYVAGQRIMKLRCLNEARHWLPRSEGTVNRAEFDSMLAGMKTLTPMLEPTP